MKPVSTSVSFPEVENEILKDWESTGTFRAQEAWRNDAPEFSFYDGPPFANGLPHYGHLLANTIKDIVPRYWLMKGFKVRRRFGWDCHGLPVEFEVEKKENLKGRPDILKMGIGKFNEICRSSVLHYAEEWQKTITRLGRWVDWNDQYRTMDKDYMETVWWVFAELHRKGLVYQDFKVVPFSPRTSSVVSNFEANQNYKQVQDPAITVKFKLESEDVWLLAWTTTPWTLPSNLALAVSPTIEYARIRDHETNEVWVVATNRLPFLYPGKKKSAKGTTPEGEPYTVLATVSGADLVGLRYEPLFPYFAGHPNAFCVLAGDFVSTDEGTGIVHQAPAFGEDDFRTCKAHGIQLVDPIDENGVFTDLVWDYKTIYLKDADKLIIRDLKERKQLVRQDTLEHSYPFDERTDTPLIYKAVPAWYVAVEKLVDRLVANNQKINWVPEHIKEGRMGSWLKNARDWSISRNRFWGTPLPVWVCETHGEHVEVFSSVADLQRRSGREIPDIHLHYVHDITFPCSVCKNKMMPVNLVFDCWFESGSMPYAQLHYPFAHKDSFAKVFPADFVGEGLDQTRGWFYTLNVLATALFDQPAFKNVIVNGVILDESGKKMSKRHRNYTAPDELMHKYGADSVRLYMVNSSLLKAEDLIFVDNGVRDITRMVLLPLWNAYGFLFTYAQAENWKPHRTLAMGEVPKLRNEFDRWIISRLQSLVQMVQKHMVAYKLYLVVPEVLAFQEDLTNWYIRLNRRRFWGTGDSDGGNQQEAFETLFYVLTSFVKVFAPFAPFVSDRLYKNLVDGLGQMPASVHLCDIPEARTDLIDVALEQRMNRDRLVVNLGRSLRQMHKIKTRQSLRSMTVITRSVIDQASLIRSTEILQKELNVKDVQFTTDEVRFVRLGLKPNLRTLGKKLGRKLNEVKSHLEKLSADQKAVAQLLLTLDDQGSVAICDERLLPEDFLIDRSAPEGQFIATEQGITVLFDAHLDPDLLEEGLARELVNRIQKLRKDSGLKVSDRIKLQVLGSEDLVSAMVKHRDYICGETLATSVDILTDEGKTSFKFKENYEIDEMSFQVALEVAGSEI